jgi:hypothetical protein
MALSDIVVVLGLALAGAGHLLVHEVRGAAAAWNRLDGLFPAAWRAAPPLAGTALLGLGTLGVLLAMLS